MFKATTIWRPWLLALLSGFLMALAWPVQPFTFLVFVAWVPLLVAAQQSANDSRFFWMAWLSMLVWNTLTTWWVWNASQAGAVGAIVANSLLMVTPWMAYRFVRKHAGHLAAIVGLICFWMCWEYFHFHWQLSWPWLTLGNALAMYPKWIYWYSITGVAGGTAWIIAINGALFLAWMKISSPGPFSERISGLKSLAPALMLLAIPLVISLLLRPENEKGKPAEVVVVQPNVEPYTEKFSTPPSILLRSLIQLTSREITPATQLILWPETALPLQSWEDELTNQQDIITLKQWLTNFPNAAILTGVDSYKRYAPYNAPNGFSVRQLADGTPYEAFNSALFWQKSSPDSIQLYHKSKLVPGVETLPTWLNFMGSLFDSFGGITGTLGKSDTAVVFQNQDNLVKPAPVICYESIYGNYVADYLRSGANLIAIITNDGWWGNTAGYRQHQQYAVLRAIETQKWVARSANTGISCFIKPDGSVLQPQPWDTAAAIKQTVYVNNNQTFFVKFGDWLSNLSVLLSVCFIGFAFYKKKTGRQA